MAPDQSHIPERFRIQYDDLSSKEVEKAKNELRETPEVVKDAIEKLRQLLKEEKNLCYSDRDEVLIRYLRPVKYYPESAVELIKRIAKFKKDYCNVLKGLMPQNLEEVIMNYSPVNVLVDRDQDGRRILIDHVGKRWNTKKVSGDQVFQLFYLVHQAAALEPATQVNGVVVIMDFEGLSLSQVGQLTPSFSNRLLTFIQEAMPLRLKEVHIVNQPGLFKMIWAIFKPLIQKKLAGRLQMHGSNLKELHKYINPEFLPEDYGGSLPRIDYSAKDWYPTLRTIDNVIEENNSFGFKA